MRRIIEIFESKILKYVKHQTACVCVCVCVCVNLYYVMFR